MIKESLYDVLVVIDHYLPGRLAGGPVTTLSNMTSRLKDIRFLIVTLDHDLDKSPYTDILIGVPTRVGNADVIYLPKKDFNPNIFRRITRCYAIPWVYLNSFFSLSTIITLLSNRIKPMSAKIICAPRGEFSEGALQLKHTKKMIYIRAFKALSLGSKIIYQASSDMEAKDIRRVLGISEIRVAPDVPEVFSQTASEYTENVPHLVFLSRIVRKKNLAYALERVLSIDIPLTLDIYGPLEDPIYWAECQNLMRSANKSTNINYCGTVKHREVYTTFGRYTAFLFPTLGENYGHVIFEALAAGCRVILSDQTPWQDLQAWGVGWVIPLSNPRGYEKVIREILTETSEERQAARARCIAYAEKIAEASDVLDANIALFKKIRE